MQELYIIAMNQNCSLIFRAFFPLLAMCDVSERQCLLWLPKINTCYKVRPIRRKLEGRGGAMEQTANHAIWR